MELVDQISVVTLPSSLTRNARSEKAKLRKQWNLVRQIAFLRGSQISLALYY